ncbi:MAG: TIR domain-containing protein [Lachnospiraceae bacterium]|nr:TIR domain-containing protein [Lachnospiraceae bacterium]
MENKTVFISYCHKDVTKDWIVKLATKLGEHGINCIVDIYDLHLGQDLNYFMEQIKNVDKVLILLGKNYQEKANDRKGGVGTETQIISNEVYNDVEQTKFIPIVISKNEEGNAYLPYYLETRLYTDFSDNILFAKNFEEVVRQIFDFPKNERPPVINAVKKTDDENKDQKEERYKNKPNINIIQNLWSKSPYYALVNDSETILDFIPNPSYFMFIPSKVYFHFENGECRSILTLSPISYNVIEEQIVTGSTKNVIVKSNLPSNFAAKKGERDIISNVLSQDKDFQVSVSTYPFLVIISEVEYSYHNNIYKDILLSTPLQTVKINEKMFGHIKEYLLDNYKHEVYLPVDSSSIYEKAQEQVISAFKEGAVNQTFFGGKEGGYGFVLKEINRLITPIDPMKS